MSEYLIVIRIPMQALDDPNARDKAKEILKDINIPEASIKLQRIETNKAPVGVSL